MSAARFPPTSDGRLEAATGPARTGPPPALADARLLELADQCVMCGLCLPHCPTYRISLDEAESPRGRIALARSIASGRIAPGPVATRHLDQCLACLSCEQVCPSDVQYGAIITRSRAALERVQPRGAFRRLLNSPRALVAMARIGGLLQAHRWLPKLARWLPRRSLVRALAEQVPAAPRTSTTARKRSPTIDRGPVALFRGCVASVYDRDTHAAAKTLLEALGHDVRVPRGTPCCGALARHGGDADAADRQSDDARSALAETGASTVLVSATGCFGDLRDHAAGLNVVDVHAFLAQDARIAQLRFRPLVARVALHLPCTQINVVDEVASIRALLDRIPGIEPIDLPEQPRCCGAAGNYFIEHPDIAGRLRAEKLGQVEATRPDLLLTTNIGCRIHLGNGLRGRATELPVLHPLALLAQQLDNDTP